MTESSWGHPIQLHHTPILSTEHREMIHINKQATVKGLFPNYMKREVGFSIRKT
jgi:hypothetical protein